MATHAPVSPELWETQKEEFLGVVGHQSSFGISETLSQVNKVEENNRAGHMLSFSGPCMCGHTHTYTRMHIHHITHTYATQTHMHTPKPKNKCKNYITSDAHTQLKLTFK